MEEADSAAIMLQKNWRRKSARSQVKPMLSEHRMRMLEADMKRDMVNGMIEKQ